MFGFFAENRERKNGYHKLEVYLRFFFFSQTAPDLLKVNEDKRR